MPDGSASGLNGIHEAVHHLRERKLREDGLLSTSRQTGSKFGTIKQMAKCFRQGLYVAFGIYQSIPVGLKRLDLRAVGCGAIGCDNG